MGILLTDEEILNTLNEFYQTRTKLSLNAVMPSDKAVAKAQAHKIIKELEWKLIPIKDKEQPEITLYYRLDVVNWEALKKEISHDQN